MSWLKSVSSASVAAVMMFSGLAAAEEVNARVPATKPATFVLACPAGAVQSGGARSQFEATMCTDTATGRFNGPYVGLFANGQVRAKGQYLNGNRTGSWVYFDESGAKTYEISFYAGDYDGRRVEFHPNGRVKLEETWVKGKREGLVRHFDAMGDVVSVKEFRDNRAVATR